MKNKGRLITEFKENTVRTIEQLPYYFGFTGQKNSRFFENVATDFKRYVHRS